MPQAIGHEGAWQAVTLSAKAIDSIGVEAAVARIRARGEPAPDSSPESRRGEPERPGAPLSKPLRHVIESVNETFTVLRSLTAYDH